MGITSFLVQLKEGVSTFLKTPAMAMLYLKNIKNEQKLLNQPLLEDLRRCAAEGAESCRAKLRDLTASPEEKIVHQLMAVIFEGISDLFEHLQKVSIGEMLQVVQDDSLKGYSAQLNQLLIKHFEQIIVDFLRVLGFSERDIDFVLHQNEYACKERTWSDAGKQYLSDLLSDEMIILQLQAAGSHAPSNEEIGLYKTDFIQLNYVSKLSAFRWLDRLLLVLRYRTGDHLQKIFNVVFQGDQHESPNYQVIIQGFNLFSLLLEKVQGALCLDPNTGIMRGLWSEEGFKLLEDIQKADKFYGEIIKNGLGSVYKIYQLSLLGVHGTGKVMRAIFIPPAEDEGDLIALSEQSFSNIQLLTLGIDQQVQQLITQSLVQARKAEKEDFPSQAFKKEIQRLNQIFASYRCVFQETFQELEVNKKRLTELLEKEEETLDSTSLDQESSFEKQLIIERATVRCHLYRLALNEEDERRRCVHVQTALAEVMHNFIKHAGECVDGVVKIPPFPTIVFKPMVLIRITGYLLQLHQLLLKYEHYIKLCPKEARRALTLASAVGNFHYFPKFLVGMFSYYIRDHIFTESLKNDSPMLCFLGLQFSKALLTGYQVRETEQEAAQPSLGGAKEDLVVSLLPKIVNKYAEHEGWQKLTQALKGLHQYWHRRSLEGPKGTKPYRWWRLRYGYKDRDRRTHDMHDLYHWMYEQNVSTLQGKTAVLEELENHILRFGGLTVRSWRDDFSILKNLVNMIGSVAHSLWNFFFTRSRDYAAQLEELQEAIQSVDFSEQDLQRDFKFLIITLASTVDIKKNGLLHRAVDFNKRAPLLNAFGVPSLDACHKIDEHQRRCRSHPFHTNRWVV